MDDALFAVVVGVWIAAIGGMVVLVVPGGTAYTEQALDWLGIRRRVTKSSRGASPLPNTLAAPAVVIIRRGRNGTIGADFSFMMGAGFLENVTAWRTVGIEGRLGGGKTLLSVAIAKWLYERGLVRGVFSNFPIRQSYIPYVPSCVNTAVILDEGAEWADARESAKGHKGYGKYFRKLGSYLLSPSVYAVDRRMRPVTVERNLDLFMFGWWLYNWKDPRGQKGWFLFSGFESLFDKYDHRFIPADDAGILETLKEEIAMRAGSQRRIILVGEEQEAPISLYDDPLEVGDGRTIR